MTDQHHERMAEEQAKREDALKHAKAAAMQDPADLEPLRTLAAIEAKESAEAHRAVDEAESVAEAKTAREALAVLERARGVLDTAPFGAALPEPVIWKGDADGTRGALIGKGETAVLSGPGQAGKSTVALALAQAARAGGTACGLAVAKSRVALLSYEDSPTRIAHRLGWFGKDDEWDHVRIAANPAPLWDVDAKGQAVGRSKAYWSRLWHSVEAFGADLVMIDPASVAVAGMSPSDGAGVRAFLLAITEEADRIGAGVVILAHDTKAARNEARAGLGPGAGMVAGSSQWYDGARAVLHLSGPGPDDKRLLVCEKANYGPTGWGARLAPRWDGERWRGLRLDPQGASMLSRERVAATRKQWARAGSRPETKAKAEDKPDATVTDTHNALG